MIILTDITIAIWFINSENDSVCTRLKSRRCDICWALYLINKFPIIWRTKFVGQTISAALQYFIIILSHRTFYLYQKHCSFCDLDIALCHIAIFQQDFNLLLSRDLIYLKYSILACHESAEFVKSPPWMQPLNTVFPHFKTVKHSCL